MKELFAELAVYHLWANKCLLETIKKLPATLVEHEAESSFPSLRKTFEHLLWAEKTWLQRLQMVQDVAVKRDFNGDFNELAIQLIRHNEMLMAWVQDQKEIIFNHPIVYYNSKKQYFKMPVYQCLLQLFNHGTYHRGQMVTILHQLGITKIPATDYIVFKRKSPGLQTMKSF